MEASPTAAFEVPEAEFLLELLIVALDAPAQLGQIDHALEGDVFRQCREPVFGRLLLAPGPLDQQPFLIAQRIAVGGTHAHAGEARSQSFAGAFTPADGTPGALGQCERELFD